MNLKKLCSKFKHLKKLAFGKILFGIFPIWYQQNSTDAHSNWICYLQLSFSLSILNTHMQTHRYFIFNTHTNHTLTSIPTQILLHNLSNWLYNMLKQKTGYCFIGQTCKNGNGDVFQCFNRDIFCPKSTEREYFVNSAKLKM